MKRIVCLAAVVVCMVACRRESGPDSGNGAVVFSTDVRELSTTKSVVTDITESNFTQFNIMAYVHGQETPYFEEEQTATKQTTGGLAGFFTVPEYFYWPVELNLDFFAYCGAGVSAEGITNEGGKASVSYTVPAQADEDLVVSSALNCSRSGARLVGTTSWSQELAFTHALVKIDTVLVKVLDDSVYNTADYTFTISDIRIKEAKNSGVLNFNGSGGLEWTDTDGSADYIFTVPPPFPGDSSCVLMAADGTHVEQFIVLPQILYIYVTYGVTPTAGGASVLENKTARAMLSLKTGKAYKIILSLSGPVLHVTSIINPSGWVY